jgi:hypothetical protein
MAYMQPMRADSANTVVGFAVQGTRIDVAVDPNLWQALDDGGDQAIKTEALSRWKTAWSEENPGRHATLTVRLIDYRGHEFFRETTKV